jgi:hypothetical protein
VPRLFSGPGDGEFGLGMACGGDASASDFILLFDFFAPFSVCCLKLFGEPEILLRDSSLIMS